MHSVVAEVIGWELTNEALQDDGLKHPLEQSSSSCWNSPGFTPTSGVELNSSFNLIHSNWNLPAIDANKISFMTPEIPSESVYLPPLETNESLIFTPLYKKDYQYGYKGKYNYNPGPSNLTDQSQTLTTKDKASYSTKISPPKPLSRSQSLVLAPSSQIFIPEHSRFFVIKSFNEEDVQASFTHKVWASTDLGNKRLNRAFMDRPPRSRIFLFFSVNGSGKFCGVAELLSGLINKKETASLVNKSVSNESPWLDKSRYNGYFQVQWMFIKDVYNNNFRHFKIRMQTGEFKPVTNSRDTQELPFETGREMLAVFRNVRSNSSFLSTINSS